MADQHHTWRIGHDPPTIRPHSLAKHRVLRAYLERYVSVLTANPAQDQLRLTLVDGFAGGGRYLDSQTKEDRPGSPLIMLEAMRVAEATAREARSKPFVLDVTYFFIEKDPEAFEYLRNILEESEYRGLLGEKIHLLRDGFEAQVSLIVRDVKQRGRAGRTIFVLDQFGYTDVPLATIRGILEQLDNAEILLTFASDFLIDHLTTSDQTQQILSRVGISLPSHEIEAAKNETAWRRLIQFALHREIPEKTGAKYYTPFFIRSPDSHRDFWLIHLSGHYRARDVMVGLHWAQNTSFAHYGKSGLGMLGYDQDTDRELTKQSLLPGFMFDDMALAASQESLQQQLPERVAAYFPGIAFNDLFANLTNEAPVTADVMREVLNDLAEQGLIQVRDKSGALKRHPRIRAGSDIIVPNPQRRLFDLRGMSGGS